MKKIFILFLFFSISSVNAQTDRFTIKNVNVNTKNNEFGAILTSDAAVFYSKSTFNNTKNFNEKSANLYKGVLEPNGQISKGLKFPTDATHAVFSDDGNTVYYSKRSGNKTFQLYRANIDHSGRWKNSIKLPFNNPNYTFKQPALNTDNTKLFFVSNMPSSYGKTDIYYVNISNQGIEFSDPINLGKNVNTAGLEIYPFVGEKDKLFFSSDSRNSMGGLDVFESFNEKGVYVNTSNLGIPINSPNDDFAYVLIPNTDKGYLSSNRQNGIGGIDIYYFKDRKPSLNKCSQAINGVVKNKISKKVILEASVEVFSTKDHMGTVLTNNKGEFVINNVECEERYDIVSYKEGYNGFAEVQAIPEKDKQIILYLDPEFPEGFEEEFDFSNEMVVYDTETNEVISTKSEGQKAITNANLSFAEKRELNRIEKERVKRERIQAQDEAERIEAQKLEDIRIARLKTQTEAAEKDKQERLARAEDRAKQLRLEKEIAVKAENDKIEAERSADEKTLAEKQETDRLAQEQKRQDIIEETRIAQQEKETQDKIKAERIAQIETEQKHIKAEEQATLLAQKNTAEKNRLNRIALATEIAEKLRLDKEITVKTENNRIEAERLANEKALIEEQEAERITQEKERQDIKEEAQITQQEFDNQQKVEKEQIIQAQTEQKRIEEEKQAAFIALRNRVEKEQSDRIAIAQETASRLRNEEVEAENEKIDATRIEEERQQKIKKIETNIQVLEKEQKVAINLQDDKNNVEIDAATIMRRKDIENERNEKITLAKATAEILKDEQIEAEKEEIARNILKEEREKQIAEAQATAEKIHLENEIIEKQASLAALKEVVEKERLNRITLAEETANKLRVEQIEAENAISKASRIEQERQQEITQTETTIQVLEKEQEVAMNLHADENNNEIDAATRRQQKDIEIERVKNIAQAKATAEKLRNEQIEAEKEEIARNILKEERERQIAEAQETAKKLRIENEIAKKVENDRIEIERLAQAQAKQQRIETEKQAVLQAQKDAVEKERLNQIALKVENDRIETERLAKEQAIARQQEIDRLAQEQETRDKIEIANIAQEEQKKQQKLEKERIAQAQAKKQQIEVEKQAVLQAAEKLTQEKEARERIESEYLTTDEVSQQPEEQYNNSERCARNINGIIQSSTNMESLAGATLDMYFDGQNIESTTTDKNGEFHFYNVDCDTKYTLICFKKDFNNIAKADINTESIPDIIVLLLDPDPAIIESVVVEPVVAVEEKIIAEQPVKEIVPIIKKETAIIKEIGNVDKEKTTKISVQKEDNTEQPEKIEIVEVVENNIPQEEAPIIKKGIIQINPIYFDLDEHYLTLSARRELDKIIVTLRQNPTMIIESGSHTDTRGHFDYNLNLSEKRSQEAVGYLVANGADPDRISGRGYGETMPLNHCFDGIKCKESEHLQNRRTEFVILRY